MTHKLSDPLGQVKWTAVPAAQPLEYEAQLWDWKMLFGVPELRTQMSS